jgi:uncharacterized protein YecE (DUF72 family)
VEPQKRVLFGVAGWSYPDWKGIVYPGNCKDTLRAVAERIELIEINSTFYGMPSGKNCSSWVRRTEDLGTWFTAKLPAEFTHQGVRDPGLIEAARTGFAPLVESGRCLGFLAQCNYQFEFTADSVEQLTVLARTFGEDAQLFVEVRHKSWNGDAALAALRRLGVSVAALDYPGMQSGFARDVTGVHGRGGVAYFRLHGRNQAWFQKGAGRDQVYDWEYSDGEVVQLEARIERIEAAAVRTLVVANNHFHGKAMKLLEQLLQWYRARDSGA